MRAKSIFILEGVEGVDSVLQDEVRVPVEAPKTILRLAHVAAIRLSIIHKAVVGALELHHTKPASELRLKKHSVRIINTTLLGVVFTDMAETPCVAWRTLAFKVVLLTDTCTAVSAWIGATHCNCGGKPNHYTSTHRTGLL